MEDLNLKDFLEREEITFENEDDIKIYLQGKVILVTGAGGMLGSEVVRQICKFSPKKIILFDICENGVYNLQQELRFKYLNIEIIIEIGSIRDKNRIEEVLAEHYPTIVFHSAAHKHIPLMENNPGEAIKNNIIGTYNLANACGVRGVKSFTLFSSEKAVNPNTVMGATKRYSEMIIQYLTLIHKTKYNAVRFGNILGSNGSVFDVFKKQILRGGPIMVANREVSRRFILPSEAAQLALYTAVFAKDGEIFSLDINEEIKIYDLARNMIKKLSPDKDIEINEVGLRLGDEPEKRKNSNLNKTQSNKISVEKQREFGFSIISKMRGLEFDLNVLSNNFIKQNLFELIEHFEKM